MKIITILIGNVYTFPPVMNLLHAFEELNIKNILVTTKTSNSIYEEYPKTNIKLLDIDYENIISPVKKMINIPNIRKKIWNYVDDYYDNETILWIVSDVTLKFLGNEVLNRKYILHLMELSEKLLYYKKIPFLKMDERKIGNKAIAIVVPEYNRAHLTKLWWNLEKLPYVLPNKPYNKIKIEKNSIIEDTNAKEIFDKIGNKKIILYQGIMSKERPLDMFIDAVDRYNGKYAFVIMSGGENIYQNKNSDNYYFIPFVTPPKHLQITSHAYIGVLSYIPTKNTGYSPLNALYCAPNKTFEYSMFGVPMIGNDIPGLRFLFETKKVGVSFAQFNVDSICNAIDIIESNYENFSVHTKKYYDECDYQVILKNILESLNENNI